MNITSQDPNQIPTSTPHGGADLAHQAEILVRLRDGGDASRADLAAELRLSRSTVSHVVADLFGRGLVRAVGSRGGTGRPETVLALDGDHVAGVGAAVSRSGVATMALTMTGRVLARREAPCAESPRGSLPKRVLRRQLAATVAEARHQGVHAMGVVVAIEDHPGADLWTRQALDLTETLDTGAPVTAERAHLLAVTAEAVWASPRARRKTLVLLAGKELLGGIVDHGSVLRGAQGMAGALAHLQVGPTATPCACGGDGCWQAKVGLDALIELAAGRDDWLLDPNVAPVDRVQELAQRAAQADSRTLNALEHVGFWIGAGAAVAIRFADPYALVIGGAYAALEPYLRHGVVRGLHSGMLAPEAGHVDLVFSSHDRSPALWGAAHHALTAVYRNPALAPHRAADLQGATA